MFLLWLIVLLCWWLAKGLAEIPAVAWLLLLPFAIQDIYDNTRKTP